MYRWTGPFANDGSAFGVSVFRRQQVEGAKDPGGLATRRLFGAPTASHD